MDFPFIFFWKMDHYSNLFLFLIGGMPHYWYKFYYKFRKSIYKEKNKDFSTKNGLALYFIEFIRNIGFFPQNNEFAIFFLIFFSEWVSIFIGSFDLCMKYMRNIHVSHIVNQVSLINQWTSFIGIKKLIKYFEWKNKAKSL